MVENVGPYFMVPPRLVEYSRGQAEGKNHKKFDNWFTFELTEVIFFFRRVSAKTSYRSELPD